MAWARCCSEAFPDPLWQERKFGAVAVAGPGKGVGGLWAAPLAAAAMECDWLYRATMLGAKNLPQNHHNRPLKTGK